jgi:type I restriction enzyme, R subunit
LTLFDNIDYDFIDYSLKKVLLRCWEGATTVNEATTCRTYVIPKLEQANWYHDPHDVIEQKTFTDGRIVVAGRKVKRRPEKRADYLLKYTRDYTIAVVEAKADYKLPGDGLQQAKEYAAILGLQFAYATNGLGIIEFDYLTGQEHLLDAFPTPGELWARLRAAEGIDDDEVARRLLIPSFIIDKVPRYYQEIAINRAIQNIVQNSKKRILLTMATGTGKTLVAFQVCWKLWQSRWNRGGKYTHPKILYLADRNILVDDPKDKVFAHFGDARWKIENGIVNKGREMYFATYQAIAEDKNRPGLYKEFPRDFFDLIIVDECHRGSANDEGSWRGILEYFEPAYQLGLTATPKRQDNIDTYTYFGNPIYSYSLRQGIEDGFLAPYHVHRVVTSYDYAGWRPSPGELDRYRREIPDTDYTTKDFEKKVALLARTEAIARHLTDFLKRTDRFAKTIVFCVSQEHADDMRRALNNLNIDLVRSNPDYVCRVTAEEGDIGRGTRVRDDYDKYYFTILDYTGSATKLFADPDFDGDPVMTTEEQIDDLGNTLHDSSKAVQSTGEDDLAYAGDEEQAPVFSTASQGKIRSSQRKYYVDGGRVEIIGDQVYELDADDNRLRMIRLTDYTAGKVRSLYPNAAALRGQWANPQQRKDIIDYLENRGITFEELMAATQQPDADPFDLLCSIAFNTPLRTRRERASRLRKEQKDFFAQYKTEPRAILDALLEKYAEHGTAQFEIPGVLGLTPISNYGNIIEIARLFGGSDNLREAVHRLQTLLYEDVA